MNLQKAASLYSLGNSTSLILDVHVLRAVVNIDWKKLMSEPKGCMSLFRSQPYETSVITRICFVQDFFVDPLMLKRFDSEEANVYHNNLRCKIAAQRQKGAHSQQTKSLSRGFLVMKRWNPKDQVVIAVVFHQEIAGINYRLNESVRRTRDAEFRLHRQKKIW